MPSPPEPPVFFIDRSLGGKVVPTALAAAGWRVQRHDDHFRQDERDVSWIAAVGQRGWIILTADQRIRYNPLEKQALLRSGTHAFLFAARKDLTGREMAEVFLRAHASILRAVEKQPPPALFKVYQDGRVDRWLT